MNIVELMDVLSLWGIFFILMAAILLSIEFGFLLGKREEKRVSEAKSIRTGPVVTATLGLLAFMLAFTFSTVTSRQDERKHLVIDESNAIGTAYLRAEVLPQADRDNVQRALNHYLSLRIAAVQAGKAGELEQLNTAKELQNELWLMAVDIAARSPTPITALFMQSLNEVFDMHQKRVTVGLHHRMPSVFWVILFGLAIVSMIVGGYDSGLHGGRRSITSLFVALAFSVVLLLVVTLDRPGRAVTQFALIDLQQDISKSR